MGLEGAAAMALWTDGVDVDVVGLGRRAEQTLGRGGAAAQMDSTVALKRSLR